MKHIFLLLLLPLASIGQFKAPKAQNVFINDYTNTLTAEQINTLAIAGHQFQEKSTDQICIVIIDDFQEMEIEDFTLALGRAWGVGQSKLNNGVLYVISPKQHKDRIEVGPGLQGPLPDVVASRIQEEVRSLYRNGQYYEGISKIQANIIRCLGPDAPEQLAKQEQIKAEKDKASENILWFLALSLTGLGIAITVICIIVDHRRKKRIRKQYEEEKKQRAYRGYAERSSSHFERPLVFSSSNLSDDYTPSPSGSSSSSSDDNWSRSSDSSPSFDSGDSFGGGSFDGGGASDSW